MDIRRKSKIEICREYKIKTQPELAGLLFWVTDISNK